MTIDLAFFKGAFLEEAKENIAILERGLLRLEREPDQLEPLHEIFRAAHSIKGAAGTVGFKEVADFTHRLETVLDAMRQGTLPVTSEGITALLQATDEVRRLVDGLAQDQTLVGQCAVLEAMMEKLHREGTGHVAVAPLHPGTSGKRWLELALQTSTRLFVTGLDPSLLFSDLATLGVIEEVTCDMSQVPALSELEPSDCHICWKVRMRTEVADSSIQDVFLFVGEDCLVTITDLTEPSGSVAVPQKAEAAVASNPSGQETSTLRVSSDKVDSIIDLVGELVIAQSMVMQLMGQSAVAKNPTLRDAIESMTRNMQELQERVMGIRMVPIATLFGRFSRVVRDTSAALGKSVKLELIGQETEIDKAVVERLIDPLTHLVRNSLDHGLETDAERAALGKLEPACIRLHGQHVAGGVVIEVEDNGRGLNTSRIREKAEQRGLIAVGEPLTDDQIHALIFEPGFSTADAVSDLSGRGVGMDVVRRYVDALNGSIVLTSRAGLGTTVRIRLPLTLAILDGLMLRVDKQTYVVPLLSVVESFRPDHAAVKNITGTGRVAIVRDVALPLVDLGTELGLTAEPKDPCRAMVVVVEADGRRIGLVVDALVGQSQVVVKSVETHYRRVDGVMGATILGDGTVAFIADVAGLARLVWQRRGGACASRAA